MTVQPDAHEVREFVETYVAQARAATKGMQRPGLLQMILVNPADDEISGIYRYALDDPKLVQRMTTEAVSASKAGHNVYCEGRTVRRGLNGKQRGALEDTAAVFALTVDSDTDKGAAWTPTVPVSLAVETSPNNAHFWLFLERAVDAKIGKALGDQLRATTGADNDTGNVCQPFRLAGTVNYPNRTKIGRGRTVTPTRSLGFDPDTLWTPERFEQEFPATAPRTNGGGATTAGPEGDEANIPADTMLVIRGGVEDADRSLAFWNVIKVLKHNGYTIAGIIALLERFPNGIASKYRGRLQREVERVWAKLDGNQQQQTPPQTKSFQLKPFSAIKVSTEPNYLVKGILPRAGLVVVWGPPKCGKSFWTYDLAMHIALGRSYRNRKVQQGTVVYLALEGGFGFANRVEAWRRRYLGEHDQAVPFFLLDASVNLVADHEALIAAIRAQLQESPATIVIDTLNRSLPGSESRDEDMGAYIRAADAVRLAFNCLVLIVHHCGIAANRPRGHTSLAGADDCQIAIERDKDGVIVAAVEHAKDFAAGARLASKLEPVELGNDLEGDPLSSCVIVPAATPDTGPKLAKGTQFALDVLKGLIAKEGVPLNVDGVPKDTRGVMQQTWRVIFMKKHTAEEEESRKRAFNRAIEELLKRKLVDVCDGFVWLSDDRDNRNKTDF